MITWYKNGVPVRDDGFTISSMNNGQALKVYAKPDAGGNYTCKATTPYGEVSSHTIQDVKVIRKCVL